MIVNEKIAQIAGDSLPTAKGRQSRRNIPIHLRSMQVAVWETGVSSSVVLRGIAEGLEVEGGGSTPRSQRSFRIQPKSARSGRCLLFLGILHSMLFVLCKVQLHVEVDSIQGGLPSNRKDSPPGYFPSGQRCVLLLITIFNPGDDGTSGLAGQVGAKEAAQSVHLLRLATCTLTLTVGCESCRKRKIRCERPGDVDAKAAQLVDAASDDAGPSSPGEQSKPGPSHPLPRCTVRPRLVICSAQLIAQALRKYRGGVRHDIREEKGESICNVDPERPSESMLTCHAARTARLAISVRLKPSTTPSPGSH